MREPATEKDEHTGKDKNVINWVCRNKDCAGYGHTIQQDDDPDAGPVEWETWGGFI